MRYVATVIYWEDGNIVKEHFIGPRALMHAEERQADLAAIGIEATVILQLVKRRRRKE